MKILAAVQLLCIGVLSLFLRIEAADILIAIPFTGKSHYLQLRPIGLELARRGHQVTVITAFEEKNPPQNYTQVLTDYKELWELLGPNPDLFATQNLPFYKFVGFLWEGGTWITEVAMNSSNFQNFLRTRTKNFDAVISEIFFQEGLYVLAHKYKAPLILVSSFGNCLRNNFARGNPLQLAFSSHEYIDLIPPFSLFERLKNILVFWYETIGRAYYYFPRQEALVRKYMPNLEETRPSLMDLEKDAALTLLNSHFSADQPLSYAPGFVEVGGLHLKETEAKLPSDLQTIMDEAEHGVVYVSFGSNLKIKDLSEDKVNAFTKVLGRLKQQVILKWEDKILPGKPDNVFIWDWLPQSAVLAHPNVKAFVAHGGLLGLQEALFYGVPIVGVPVYGDQKRNIRKIEKSGWGVLLELNSLNEHSLSKALHKILDDEKYYNTAKELSRRFKDRPQTPLETAMFWIEYVIRHKGAKFMKSPAVDLPWYIYYHIDVAMMAALTLLFVIKIFSFIVSLFRLKPTMNTSQAKSKQKTR